MSRNFFSTFVSNFFYLSLFDHFICFEWAVAKNSENNLHYLPKGSFTSERIYYFVRLQKDWNVGWLDRKTTFDIVFACCLGLLFFTMYTSEFILFRVSIDRASDGFSIGKPHPQKFMLAIKFVRTALLIWCSSHMAVENSCQSYYIAVPSYNKSLHFRNKISLIP